MSNFEVVMPASSSIMVALSVALLCDDRHNDGGCISVCVCVAIATATR